MSDEVAVPISNCKNEKHVPLNSSTSRHTHLTLGEAGLRAK